MADEAVAAAGQEAEIDAMFSGTPAEAPQEASGAIVAGEAGAGAPPAPDPAADDTWREGYVPKAFRNADGEFTGDQDAVFKSWMDGRQRISQLEAQIAQQQREAAAQLPPTADEYIATMNWQELSERAPNAYAGGEGENPVIANLLRELHAAGVPQGKAQAAAVSYMASLNEHVPETKDEATARSEAVSYLGPNGAQIVDAVRGRIHALSRRGAIPPAQMAVLGQMMTNGPALALLDRLTAFGQSAPPPSMSQIAHFDQEKAKRDANAKLGTLDDGEWRRNKARWIAEWKAAHPEYAA